jgi:hypothetical protein
MRRELISHQLELSLQKSFEAPQLRVTEVSGERPVSDERREPWIPIKYGPSGPDDWFGVVPATVRFERAPDAAVEELHLASRAIRSKVSPEPSSRGSSNTKKSFSTVRLPTLRASTGTLSGSSICMNSS